VSCLSSAQRAIILAQIAEKEAQLELANSTYSSLLEKEVNEYRFDSNEGSQKAIRIKLKEIQEQIEWLEASLDNLYRRLNSTGLLNFNLRRKFPAVRYRSR
jgi:chromosome segregation ATPase